MKCAIVCGGLGTRLGNTAGAVPKVLAPIGGRAILDHLLDAAVDAGAHGCVLLTGHQSEAIRAHVAASAQRMAIDICRESRPLGTAGAVKAAEHLLAGEDFLLLYGDVMMCLDLKRLIEVHRARSALATLAVHPNDHPHDSDLVALDPTGRIVAFYAKPHAPGEYLPNLVNAGALMLSGAMFQHIPPGKCDLGHDVFGRLVATGRMYGYPTAEYLKDIGTPERYQQVCRDWDRGLVARLHRRHARPAVFLDRDGVLNREIGGVRSAEQLELLPRAAEAVRSVNESGRFAVVITNQPVVAKGRASLEELERIHLKLQSLLGREGAYLDAIYFCPHHPDAGFEGEVPELKIRCTCRKPGIGMIQRAADDLHIDILRSVFVGDSACDFACARAAGMKAIGVHCGQHWQSEQVYPDAEAADLYEAVCSLPPWAVAAADSPLDDGPRSTPAPRTMGAIR